MLEQRKNMSGTYIAIIFIVIVFFFIWGSNYRPSSSKLSQNDVAEEMKLRASHAVTSAKKDYDIILDDSPESVKSIEIILTKIHNQHQQTPYSDKQLTREALKWGAYIGEVIKVQKSGRWELDSEIGGEGSLPIMYDSNSGAFPVRWCFKRIVNGEEDNVWHKYLSVMGGFTNDAVSFFPEDSDIEEQSKTK